MYSHDGKEWFPATLLYKEWMVEANVFFQIYPNRIYKTTHGLIIPTLQPNYYVFYKENEPVIYFLHEKRKQLEWLQINLNVDTNTLHILSPIAEESPK